MERLLLILGQVQPHILRSDDDFSDKLNYRYTTMLLCIFAMVVSAKQYVGDPITCWCPAEFKDNYEDFTNKFCWVHNTYNLPISQKYIPGEGEAKAYIGYYQWVPMFLLVQALLFYLPCLMWRTLNNKTGIDVDNIIRSAKILQHTAYAEQQEKYLTYITQSLDRYFKGVSNYKDQGCLTACKHHMSRNFCLVCGSRKFGNYLVSLYLITKVLYTVNAIGQIFMLNTFLGTSYHMYGINVIKDLVTGEEATHSETFPRVTLCDFSIRDLNNIRQYTVQCVLPLNFFNEKMYIIIWFWLAMLVLANIFNMITWFIRVLLRRDNEKYIRRHLKSAENLNLDNDRWKKELKHRIRQFVGSYLKKDGILIMRLVELNSNSIVVSEITAAMYRDFLMKKEIANLPELESYAEETM